MIFIGNNCLLFKQENEALKTQLDSCRKAADDEIAKLQYDGDFLRSKIDVILSVFIPYFYLLQEMERMHQVLRANFEALTEDSEEMESKFELELNQRVCCCLIIFLQSTLEH
jgi:hypothetical protein